MQRPVSCTLRHLAGQMQASKRRLCPQRSSSPRRLRPCSMLAIGRAARLLRACRMRMPYVAGAADAVHIQLGLLCPLRPSVRCTAGKRQVSQQGLAWAGASPSWRR